MAFDNADEEEREDIEKTLTQTNFLGKLRDTTRLLKNSNGQ